MMHKYIAPKMLTANGQPSPCECTDDIVCAYCVQANLILWERREEKAYEEKRQKPILGTIRRMPREKVAQWAGVDERTVRRWLRKGRIPIKYEQRLYERSGHF